MSERFDTPEEEPIVVQVVDVSDGSVDPGDVVTAVVDPTPDGEADLVLVAEVDADGDGQVDDVAVLVVNDTDGDGVVGSEGDEAVLVVMGDLETTQEDGEFTPGEVGETQEGEDGETFISEGSYSVYSDGSDISISDTSDGTDLSTNYIDSDWGDTSGSYE